VAGVAAYKFFDVAPPEGTRAFQVPISFGGVTVVDEAFIDRAHSDGYAVHVWTINDPAEMRQLLQWGADGIMTAEPMRLEQVLCATDSPRPRHPRGAHCGHRRASIACTVRPIAARRNGRTLALRLRRTDEFAGRCAGTVRVRVPGTRRRASGRFFFGTRPPGDGGQRTDIAEIRLGPALRAAATPGVRARFAARPYMAFSRSARLKIRG
jgi:hypothetical protein